MKQIYKLLYAMVGGIAIVLFADLYYKPKIFPSLSFKDSLATGSPINSFVIYLIALLIIIGIIFNKKRTGQKQENRQTAFDWAELILLLPLIIGLLFLLPLVSNAFKQLLPLNIGWETTISILSAKPLSGIGPDRFGIAFMRYLPKLAYADYVNKRYFHASNEILEQISTTGILGSAAFITLILRLLGDVFKVLKNKKLQNKDGLGLSLGISLLILSLGFALIPVNTLYFMLFFYIAAIFYAWQRITLKPSDKKKQWSLELSIMALPIGTLFILLINWMFFRFTLAEVYAKQAATTANEKWVGHAIQKLKRAVDLNPYKDSYHISLSQLYLALMSANNDEQKNKKFSNYQQAQKVIEEAKKATILDQENARNQLMLAEAYEKLAKQVLGADDWALRSYQKAISLAPNDIFLKIKFAQFLQQTDQQGKSQAQLLDVLDIDPKCAVAYYLLGKSYYLQGQATGGQERRKLMAKAKMMLDKAIAYDEGKDPAQHKAYLKLSQDIELLKQK